MQWAWVPTANPKSTQVWKKSFIWFWFFGHCLWGNRLSSSSSFFKQREEKKLGQTRFNQKRENKKKKKERELNTVVASLYKILFKFFFSIFFFFICLQKIFKDNRQESFWFQRSLKFNTLLVHGNPMLFSSKCRFYLCDWGWKI